MKKSKKDFIELAINKFEKLLKNNFLNIDSSKKLVVIQNGFLVFDELITKKRMNSYFEKQSIEDPKLASLKDIFNVLRHYFAHFPVFNSYEECFIQKDFILWKDKHRTIHNFFSKEEGFIFMVKSKNESDSFTASFNPPTGYKIGKKILLKDIVDDNGLNFLFLSMKGILEEEYSSFYLKNF